MPVGVLPDPASCTEEVNPSYTIGSFDLFVRPSGGTEFNVGDIDTGGIQFTPNVVEKRRGKDNSLAALFRIGSDYIINFTFSEITIQNMGMMYNEDLVPFAGGCLIPFTGSRCVRTYAVRLEHDFPCEDKQLVVVFWRAAILNDFTAPLDPGTPSAVAGSIRALNCESVHPNMPYGYLYISEACPTS